MLLQSDGREVRRRIGFLGGYAVVPAAEKMQVSAIGCERIQPDDDFIPDEARAETNE